jgi:hypothetical protein
MADEGTGTVQDGQPAGTAAPAVTTQPAGTSDGTGQPGATSQTTNTSGTGDASGEDTFFDPKDLDPALVPAYKNMQKAFGKKMESIKADRQKIDAYDSFSKDPIGQIQTMAARMGYKLTRADAAAIADVGGTTQSTSNQWEPKTWDEVMARAKEEVLKDLSPVFAELQTIKKGNLEKILDESAPDWREHEDAMVTLLQEHPTLAKDPVKLYRLALPPEVLESRAAQAALKKLQTKADGARVSGTSTTKQTPSANPTGPISFQEAVEIARRQLAEKGLRGPA